MPNPYQIEATLASLGGAPQLTRASVLTASGTAAANTIVPVNTTSGAVTVTLPGAPAQGAVVAVKCIIFGTGNNVTIACSGSDVFNKTAGGTSLTLSAANQGAYLCYDTATAIWTDLADDLPLSYLNTLFDAAGTAAGLVPLSTLGDILYENATPAPARLAGNTTATKNFLTQTGTGSASAAPAWGTITAGDLPAGTTTAQGALQLDGTAGDIQALAAAAAAGSKGQAADARHVHPTTGLVSGAGDASLVLSGTTLEAATLDVIASLHPPAGSVAMNSQKLTGLLAGTVTTDAANLGQAANLAAVGAASQHGYATWTWDYYVTYCGALSSYWTYGMSSGYLHLTRMLYIPYAQTLLGNLDTLWGAGTSGQGQANTYIGVYQLTGGNAVLIGSGSSDLSSHASGILTISTGVTSWAAGWYALGYLAGTQVGATYSAYAPWKADGGSYQATTYGSEFLPGDTSGSAAPISSAAYYNGGYAALPSSVALSHFTSNSPILLLGALR